MTDDLVKRLRKWDYGESTWALLEDAADRIENLEAGDKEWQRICDSYADENQRFSDRIEKLGDELHHCFHRIEELQAALRSIAANACCDSCREAALVARKALEDKQ